MLGFHRRRRIRWKSLFYIIIVGLIAVIGDLRRQPADAIFQGPFHVVDGDTLTIDGLRMRLRGVDAPEMKQRCGSPGSQWNCGAESRRALQALVSAGTTCKAHGTDKYRRRLVRCRNGGGDVGAALVRNGQAVAYGDYGREESEAMKARRGIWKGPFERPEDWRRMHRALAPAEERASFLTDDG